MNKRALSNIITVFISLVWIVNGLICKVLGLVPRHEHIVGRILGNNIAFTTVKIIGALEILMCVWVLSRIQRRLCAVTQIALVAVMNIMEFILVPEMLLFGKLNSIFAFLFICLIWYNEFVLQKNLKAKIK